ncbi:hypothetical protein U2A4042570146 [Corynebacterium striatum]|nr:hypothetical protein U2A4042570146 [Corynebacterium striatum]
MQALPIRLMTTPILLLNCLPMNYVQ